MTEHEHRWRYLPTMDTNPPSEARECVECGVVEHRDGVGYRMDGSRIDATTWVAAEDANSQSSLHGEGGNDAA